MAKDPSSIPFRLRDRARHTASILGSVAGAGMKRLVRRSEADDAAFGEALVAEMDKMKGMAMKVGQILSYMDVPLPAATRDALARLQMGAEPLPFAVITAQVEEALGAPLADLYDSFDPQPIAAASIGQVHRAVHGGVPVAVKIQYPHVWETFDADMRNLGRLATLAALAAGVDGPALVREMHDRLKEECDYLQEARWQGAFQGAWADQPGVIIPQVVAGRTAETVLTTHFAEGADFQTFCEEASQAERDRAAALLTRFAWRSFFVFQALNADPHPGNYRFPGGDSVVFLDFGCVRRFDAAFVDAWRQLYRAVLADDHAAFEVATRATGMVRTKRFDYDGHWELMAWGLEPYMSPTYTFTEAWGKKGHTLTGPGQANARSMNVPPPWIWLARLQFGLHAVLTRLGATGNFQAILLEAMGEAPRPMGG